jgi:hypothetical protein
MNDPHDRRERLTKYVRSIVDWAAVATSTFVACFWAFWGILENFHEGWWGSSLWQNLGMMVMYPVPSSGLPASKYDNALSRRPSITAQQTGPICRNSRRAITLAA